MLPSNFPDWEWVYSYFSIWSKKDGEGMSLLDRVLKKLVKMACNDTLKKEGASLGIVDAKSIKNVDSTEEKGYDGGKKVFGMKLHIVVDTMGLLHAFHVTCANTTDRNGDLEMMELNLDMLSFIQKYFVDRGYSGDKFTTRVKELCHAEVEVVKMNELHCFKVLPKHWVVEQSFGWLEKYHR